MSNKNDRRKLLHFYQPDALVSLGMKKIMIAAFFLVSALSGYAQHLSANSGETQSIVKVLESQRDAWNRGELEAYMEGYWKSDSLLFVGKNGPGYGWTVTLQNYKKSYPDKASMGFLSFDFKEIRILDNSHAFVLGAWHLKREKDEPHGYFTLLLRKIAGEWKIIADHSS